MAHVSPKRRPLHSSLPVGAGEAPICGTTWCHRRPATLRQTAASGCPHKCANCNGLTTRQTGQQLPFVPGKRKVLQVTLISSMAGARVRLLHNHILGAWHCCLESKQDTENAPGWLPRCSLPLPSRAAPSTLPVATYHVVSHAISESPGR